MSGVVATDRAGDVGEVDDVVRVGQGGEVEEAVRRLEATIAGYGPRALVALSGGVDSSVVLALAARALGRESVVAVTAVSPSLPAGEAEVAREVAAGLGVAHRTVRTHEVDREAYVRNDALRCFHCKTELYAVLGRLARAHLGSGTTVLAGANADDRADFRPGMVAAERAGVRNPLLEVGADKATVRAIARLLGLRVADKPALACLSSRVAYGIRITPALLARIDRAERAVRALGFPTVRVRHLGGVASLEVPEEDLARLNSHPQLPALLERLRGMGWERVSVDPEGYRPGKLNRLLPPSTARTPGGPGTAGAG